jgi:cystathionine beta-lyase/cystathionine gamma-synthase
VANLEGTEDAVATASGMAATSGALLHLLRDGGHLVASQDLYEISKQFLLRDLPAFGVSVELVDFRDLDAIEAAIRPETRALLTETFSNPLMRVTDLSKVSDLAHRHGIQLVVDNTYLSPALSRPVEQGADVVVHSATKYLSGHGNVLGGIICGRRETVAGIRALLSRLGGGMSPFSAWLLLAGTKTLSLRAERHSDNALRLAELMHCHPAVEAVHYPGLPSDPGHAIARRLVDGRYGGMLAVSLCGEPAVRAFVNGLSLPKIAVSLGDAATLVWPIFSCSTVRVSVGLEEWSDLEADFRAALDAAAEAADR